MDNELPAFRKGARRNVEVSCVVWIDLLGYRSQIATSAVNPLAASAKDAIDRIDRFHSIVAKNSHRVFPTFAMNDGAMIYRDLSPRSGSVGADVISRAWDLFQEIRSDETFYKQPGARMILAAGFRARRRKVYAQPNSHAESIWRRYNEGLLTPHQAITEALHAHRYFDIVPDLQANFALTRAYLADASGTKAGLPGPAAYIDAALLPEKLPEWIDVGRVVEWTSDKKDMQTKFLEILDVRRDMGPPKRAFAGLDAVSVGARLSGDKTVKAQLHAARVRQLTRSGRPPMGLARPSDKTIKRTKE